MHVVLTAQTKVTEDEVNNQTTRTIDVQRGAQSITLASPDYVMFCETEKDFDNTDDDGNPAERHVARFGNDIEYRIKARVPAHLHGRIPPVLGRKAPLSLVRSEEHTSELQSLMRISYAVFCLKKKNNINTTQ